MSQKINIDDGDLGPIDVDVTVEDGEVVLVEYEGREYDCSDRQMREISMELDDRKAKGRS